MNLFQLFFVLFVGTIVVNGDDGFQCPLVAGSFVNGQNPSTYWKCVENVPVLMNCPEKKIFDQILEFCVFDDLGKTQKILDSQAKKISKENDLLEANNEMADDLNNSEFVEDNQMVVEQKDKECVDKKPKQEKIRKPKHAMNLS